MFIFNRFLRLGLACNTRFLALSRGNANQSENINSIRNAKKPVQPFMMFVEEYKEKMNMKRLDPETKLAIKDHWGSLSDTSRMCYYDRYVEALKGYYDALYEDFKVIKDLRILGPDDKKLLKKVIKFQQMKLKKPVRPLNEFLLYMKERGKSLVPGSTAFSEVAKNWVTLKESEKKVYQETARKNLTDYHKELCKWEKDMAVQGHFLLIRKKSKGEYLANSSK